MYHPKITIITVCLNSETHIEETIQSVITQDYDNFEYIIIDGASTDNTLNIIKRYEKYITKIVSEKDKGISDAFNKGIRFASGDVIGIVGADDKLCEHALRRFAAKYIPGYDVYRGNQLFWNDKTNLITVDSPTMKFPLPPLSLHICHNATYITKNAYEKYGLYDISFRYIMDIDLFVRYYKSGAKFFRINENLVFFRLGGISQVQNKAKWNEYKKVIRGNGGSKFQEFIFIGYLKLRMFIKDFVSIFGEDARLLLIQKRWKGA